MITQPAYRLAGWRQRAFCIARARAVSSNLNTPSLCERNSMHSLRLIFFIALFLGPAIAQEITAPEKFFAFQLGADKKMARWDKIVEYYGALEKQSGGRMKVVNMRSE